MRLLELAVQDTGPDTVLGGEAQLWLGLAYQVRWMCSVQMWRCGRGGRAGNEGMGHGTLHCVMWPSEAGGESWHCRAGAGRC